ncbi:hypothetical protein ACOVBK_002937, partial [Enterococcus faecalis]
ASTLLGNILTTSIMNEQINFIKYSVIFLVVEFCYIIIFGLFLKSFKNILLKDFLLKVFPTIFLVSMIIGVILIWCNLF